MSRRFAAAFVALSITTGAWAQASPSSPDAGAQSGDSDAQQAAAAAKANADEEGQDAKAKTDQAGQDVKAKTDQETQKAGNDVKQAGQDMQNAGGDLKQGDLKSAAKDLPAAGDNSAANQAPANTQPWSAVSAQTMGQGRDLVQGEVGFPGIQATYLHGLTNTFDVGAKVGFLYGSEGADVNLGFRAQAALRWLIYNQGNVKMSIEVDPGLYQSFIGAVAGGLVLPVKYTAAFAVTDSLYLHAGADLPLLIGFGSEGTGASIPVLVGGGAEYFISDSISITARLRLGPSFDAGAYFLDQDLFGNKHVVRFGFDATVGASFKL